MLALIAKPRPWRNVMLYATVIVAALGAYCLAYNALLGQPVTLVSAFGWPLVNAVPFIVAFEWAKTGVRHRLYPATAAALAVSLLLGWLLDGGWDAAAFEALRRIPAVILLLTALHLVPSAVARTQTMPQDRAPDPALARADWIAAAGNYIEVHQGPVCRMVRQTLREVEAALSPQGFVRIHRRYLVRRAAIVRVESRFVLMGGGKRLPLGAHYRAGLVPDMPDMIAQ